MVKQSKRANLKGPGTCIYCGAYGLTKEHMFANWLHNYIPREATEYQTSSTLVHVDHEELSVKRRTGDPHSRRIHCVCTNCNNGWMSRLQEQAKPFLVPMLLSQKTSLHKRAQTVIAAWIAMTVMSAEFSDRDKVAIPYSDRSSLRANQKPPLHWRIWIGRHRRIQHPLFSHNVLCFATKEEIERSQVASGEASNTQTTTICLGEHLLIHAMSSIKAKSIIRRWKLPSEIANGMTQIWPVRISSVTWPQTRSLTDHGIHLLANEFIDKATALVRRDHLA